MNRRTVAFLILILLLLLGLGGFYLYLTGGSAGEDAEKKPGAEGLIHVRTIYVADGENLRRPTGLGADSNGDFYVTLKDAGRVIGFDSEGDFKVKWGEQGIKQGELLAPLAVAPDRLANQVYVIDRARLRVICYDTNGRFQWERALLNPVGIALLNDEIAATTFGPIVQMTTEGETVAETGVRGFEPGEFDYPRSAVQAPDSDDLIVADTNNPRVQRVTLNGEASATVAWVTGTPPRFQDDPDTEFGVPSGITLDEKGRVFVLDGFRHKISVLDAETGKIIHTFEELEGDADGRFRLPTGIAHLGGDYFAVTDTFNDRVQIIRLLLPGEDNVIARWPWLLYLLPLLLLFLLPLLRRRTFVTREALELAARDENLRLLASAFKRLHVLPEVYAEYAELSEKDVALAPFLVSIGEPGTEDAETDAADETERLAAAASPGGVRGLTRPRRLIVCADKEQVERVSGIVRGTVKDYEWVLSEYRLEE